ncbi:hypothetical protein [Paenibacillus ihbetae]|nr:hypothetical protein [Paenibacillus ihbetae]
MKRNRMRAAILSGVLLAAASLIVWTLLRYIDHLGESYRMLG